jgi:hypothetical protein
MIFSRSLSSRISYDSMALLPMDSTITTAVVFFYAVLQGDYDSRRVKVLQYSMNPFTIARQQLATECERLQAENERLTKRLKILEEAGGRVDDLTVKVDEQLMQPSTSKEVEGFVFHLQIVGHLTFFGAVCLESKA